jgi:AraC-like DNA-binding protein
MRIRLSRPDAPHARMRADADLAFIVSFGRLLTQVPLRPVRVGVRGPMPAYHARYSPLFDCPVHFGQALDEVIFSAADTARPVAGSSPEIVGLLEACAEQLLAEYDGDSIIEQVRAALRRQMDGAALSLAQVARTLGVSARSLQRRLAEAGTNFAALLSEVRREVACERLARGDTEVATLSFLLGFSDPNSFYRAFKRWEGMTPLEYQSASRGS